MSYQLLVTQPAAQDLDASNLHLRAPGQNLFNPDEIVLPES